MELTGLHHVSAMTAQAVNNYEFYTRVLGLRLVKKTVNQDNPSSYHLFYGDELGRAGTELTFFDIPHLAPTRPGTGSIARTALRVRGEAALAYWQARFDEQGVAYDPPYAEAGRRVLPFVDFEEQRLALIDDEGAPLPGGEPWDESPVPAAMGIRGLAGTTLVVADPAPTVSVLVDVMGFRPGARYQAQNPAREIQIYETGPGGPGAQIRLDPRPDLPPERLGRGGVHHVAFRVPDEEQHAAWVDRLLDAGLDISGIIDRYYFKSIYFREPNGILFELATDGPGFAVDEAAGSLGEKLALPPFLEQHRARIEANLQPLATGRTVDSA